MQTMLGPSRITRGAVLEPSRQAEVLERFSRDGYAMLPGVLSADEVACLREIADYYIDTPGAGGDRGYAAPVYTAMVLRCTQSLHRAFCDMLVREPFLSLAEAVCGANAGFCGQNVIRSDKGTAVSKWHIDDILEFPLPPEVPRHDARIKMPVFWFSFQIALSDIDSVENGPTQLVPGSHYSGRVVPEDTEMPIFEGRKPIPILCKAGDVYLFNHQLWHRGMINQSDRRRYLMQNQYCKAWGVYRFSAKDAICNIPAEDLRGGSERMLKLLRREDVKS
ncbi:MAG: phytanoyl-CoA dioxygenase family protein [Planctomycetes bacterium]|nr:phytanoyl-CoA dioxygenase family protein [Planctomycetota bacterium]